MDVARWVRELGYDSGLGKKIRKISLGPCSMLRSLLPRLICRHVAPTRDRRLQTAFDPEEAAVGSRSLIAHQAEHEISRSLRIVTTGLVHPADPLPISLRFRPHPFGLGADRL